MLPSTSTGWNLPKRLTSIRVPDPFIAKPQAADGTASYGRLIAALSLVETLVWTYQQLPPSVLLPAHTLAVQLRPVQWRCDCSSLFLDLSHSLPVLHCHYTAGRLPHAASTDAGSPGSSPHLRLPACHRGSSPGGPGARAPAGGPGRALAVGQSPPLHRD